MVDYSKWDKLVVSDSESDAGADEPLSQKLSDKGENKNKGEGKGNQGIRNKFLGVTASTAEGRYGGGLSLSLLSDRPPCNEEDIREMEALGKDALDALNFLDGDKLHNDLDNLGAFKEDAHTHPGVAEASMKLIHDANAEAWEKMNAAKMRDGDDEEPGMNAAKMRKMQEGDDEEPGMK